MAAKRTVFAPTTTEYYRFSAGDQVWNNWLLFVEDEEVDDSGEPLRVRARNKKLVCPRCHRLL